MANLTEYERQRLENIKRREKMLADLNIHVKSEELSAYSKYHTASSKRHRVQAKIFKAHKPTSPIRRRSLRLMGNTPDGYVAKGLDDSPRSDISDTNQPPSVHLGPLSMENTYRGSVSDRALVQTIVRASDQNHSCPEIESVLGDKGSSLKLAFGSLDAVNCENGLISGANDNVLISCKFRSEDDGPMDSLDIKSLRLEEKNVARIVPSRITSVCFFPTANIKMIVVGNKLGTVGFWDFNATHGDNGDGIYSYEPHSDSVSGISIHPNSMSKIHTCSYDGFIRSMDVKKEVFDLLYKGDHAIVSLSQRSDEMNCIYFGEGGGGLNMLDERAVKSSNLWLLHAHKINSINFNVHNPNIMATSSTDRTVKIWDLRFVNATQPKPLKIVGHKRAVHSANFSPSGKLLATTSFDDNVGLISGENFEQIDMIHHYNQTGRWVSSFRAIWGWDDAHMFIGNMKRGIDVISSAQKKPTLILQSPYMTAIPARLAAHPSHVGMLAGATGGGQVYIWTSS